MDLRSWLCSPRKGWFCEGFPEMIGEFFGDLVLQIGGPMDRLFPGYFGDGKTVIWRGFCQLPPGTPTSLNTFSSTACQSPKAIRNPTSRCVSDLELFCGCEFSIQDEVFFKFNLQKKIQQSPMTGASGHSQDRTCECWTPPFWPFCVEWVCYKEEGVLELDTSLWILCLFPWYSRYSRYSHSRWCASKHIKKHLRYPPTFQLVPGTVSRLGSPTFMASETNFPRGGMVNAAEVLQVAWVVGGWPPGWYIRGPSLSSGHCAFLWLWPLYIYIIYTNIK